MPDLPSLFLTVEKEFPDGKLFSASWAGPRRVAIGKLFVRKPFYFLH